MPKVVVDNDMSSARMSDEFLITKEFNSSTDFSQYIERMANSTGSYIDAVVDYCDKNDIEIESVKKLLSTSLKDKIKTEAESLNLVKGNKTGKLPI